MVVSSHALPGIMFTFLLLSMAMLLFVTGRTDLRSPLDRMSLAFQVENKPFGNPQPKPKGEKPKKFRDLMAIAKWSGMGIVSMSGKVQGTVMLNNNVVRVWHKTKTVRDTATNLVKGILSGVSTAYKDLTAGQIAGWVATVPNFIRKNALAEVKHLTGSQAFQRVNNILKSLSIAGTPNAPGVITPPALTGLDGAAAAGAATFGLTIHGLYADIAVLPANVYARVYATRQVGVSKQKFSKSDYRLIGVFPPATVTAPLDIEADYMAKFGVLTSGSNIGLAFELVEYNAGSNLFGKTGRIYSNTVVAP